jgi:hypothetical protein
MKKSLALFVLFAFSQLAYSENEALQPNPQSSTHADQQDNKNESNVSGKPYQKRLTTFSDSFDLLKKKVYIIETYPTEMSDEAKKIFVQNGFEVVDEPSVDDVQIILIEDAQFSFKKGSSNWVSRDYNGLVTSNTNDADAVQKMLEGLRPPISLGIDAGAFYGNTVAAISGATRGALENRDFKKKIIPFDQAMTLKVSVKKLTADGKTMTIKTIKPNVNTAEGSHFLVGTNELFAAAIDCLITCTK